MEAGDWNLVYERHTGYIYTLTYTRSTNPFFCPFSMHHAITGE